MDRLRASPLAVAETRPFRLGDWLAFPAENALVRAGLRAQVEPRCMDVLVCLAEGNGAVISADQLLDQCWAGIDTGDNPLHKTIAQLRRVLGDSATRPIYIETIRKRGYRLMQPVQLLDAGIDISPLQAPSASPFRGLEAFDSSHSDCFFGRDRAVADLAERVGRQCAAGNGFLLVLGSSGCGKTSLLRAGLMARLDSLAPEHPARPAAVLHWRLDMPGERHDAWHQLAALLETALVPGQTVDTDWLSVAPESAVEALLAARAGGGAPAGRLYLLIDPFEHLFTLPGFTAAARAAFVEMLARLAACPRVFVLAACRNEFYPDITRLAALSPLRAGAGQFDVPPPTPAELAQMIRHPALAAGLSFEVDAGGARLDDELRDAAARGNEVLPLLEYALAELYRSRDERGRLTFAAYRAMGGVEGAIGQRAEHTVAALPAEAQQALGRLMSRMLVLDDGDHVSARRARFAELGGSHERRLLDALVAARLLVTEFIDGEPCFSVSHEALFRHWPRATAWIESHRAALRLRARITPLVARWSHEDESPDFLLPPGRQLDEATELLAAAELDLTPDETRWLAASAERARGLRRRRKLAIGALALLALVATLLAAIAFEARQVADARRREAEGLMSFMVGGLADKLRPIGRLDLLEDVSSQALRFLAEGGREGDLGSRMARARALQVGAEVEQARGETDAAELRLRAALALLPDDPARIDDIGLLKLLGELRFWMGQIGYDRRDFATAGQYFGLYRATADRWAELRPTDRDAMTEQSYALSSLGSVALAQGRLDDAIAAFDQSVRLKRQLRTTHEDDDLLGADLADTLSWLANAHGNRPAPARALEFARAGFALIAPIAERRRGEADWQSRASVLAAQQAMWLADLGDDAGALDRVRVARDYLDRALAIDPGRPEWQRRRAQLDCREAELAFAATPGARERDRRQVEAALARLAPMLERDVPVATAIDAGRCLRQLARLALAANDLGAADAALARGIGLLASAEPRAEPALGALLRDHLALARREGNPLRISRARAALADSLARLERAPLLGNDFLPARLAARLALTEPGQAPDAATRELATLLARNGYRGRELAAAGRPDD
ncbi:winged helix-turn-helix domain-containing protein [Derxia gummosa]|uniref:Winged helix-turn-helix domain-containing protein n=1 Tax=Derxia gummosa DSM 723 TaxID=1121388 RepID=A0A8B6X8H6_9BURK|nr:winged helix-turn-helix domain-containing protein [Derxia gummosa]